MLPLAARIGEAKVNEFYVFVLDFAQDILGGLHLGAFPGSWSTNGDLGGDGGGRNQMASVPVSPVRMRIASSIRDTKILPSPMRPVCAALRIASMAGSTVSSATTISIFTFGRKSTTYSAPL